MGRLVTDFGKARGGGKGVESGRRGLTDLFELLRFFFFEIKNKG